jgi:hypothetical protein
MNFSAAVGWFHLATVSRKKWPLFKSALAQPSEIAAVHA